MAVYLVSFDLQAPERQESVFRAVIRTGDWGRVSSNTYVIHTPDAIEDVFKTIQPEIQQGDSLYVMPLRRPYQGQGPKELTAWLEEILPY